jgi:pilus assembly protein CpaE
MSDARNGGSFRFVLIDGDELARVKIKQHLLSSGFRVIGETEDQKAGIRLIRGLHPDVIIMEIGADAGATLDVVRRLREELPTMGLILLSRDASPELILGSVRAGAHEFLTIPIDLTELDRAVERLRKMMAHMQTAQGRRGRTLAVYQTKGGVGSSSVATNLALSLLAEPERRVGLVDFNLQVGDLALMLDIEPEHTFARGIEDGTIDEAKLQTMLARHRSGLRLLTITDRPEESDLILRNHIPELFGLLNTMFDYVVVDVNRHLDERTLELLDLADTILLISTLDIPTIRNARRYVDLFERLEIPKERIRLIVNRFQEGTSITIRDLENTVGTEVFWSLPNEFRPMRAAIDSGNPVLLDSPRSRLARSYRELGAALCERPSEENGTPPNQDSLQSMQTSG